MDDAVDNVNRLMTLATLALGAVLIAPGTIALPGTGIWHDASDQVAAAAGATDATVEGTGGPAIVAETGAQAVVAETGIPATLAETSPIDLPTSATAAWAAVSAPVDAVVAELGCQDVIEIHRPYWQGQVTDTRALDGLLLATVVAQLVTIVHDAEALVGQSLGDMLGELPVGAMTTERVTDIALPADVQLAWNEEFIDWERLVDRIIIAAPIGGVLPATSSGDVVFTDTSCGETPLQQWVKDERYDAAARQSLTPQRDGWYVDAASIGAEVVAFPDGDPMADTPFDQGHGTYASSIMAYAEAALDDFSMTLYQTTADASTEDGDEGSTEPAQAPDVAWEPNRYAATDLGREIDTNSGGYSAVTGSLAATLSGLLALMAAATLLLAAFLRRQVR